MHTSGLVALVVVLVASTVFGLIFRSRSGRFRAPKAERAGVDPVLLRELGVDPAGGRAVTLLQFSSRVCAYCRSTRELCTQIAAARGGVRHVEVDAEQHLPATRALGILSTPTLLVLDPDGVEVSRASGPPVRAAIEHAVDAVTGSARRIRW